MPLVKTVARQRRRERTRKSVLGSSERPRLSVYRSMNHLHAQIIDDSSGRTLVGLSSQSKAFSARKDAGNVKGARELGKLLARKAIESKISQVVFDRGGAVYHGRIKAFAEGAREGGLKF